MGGEPYLQYSLFIMKEANEKEAEVTIKNYEMQTAMMIVVGGGDREADGMDE